jgi:ParB family chromosome partitioning protein
MNARRGGLGRGLGALIPAAAPAGEGAPAADGGGDSEPPRPASPQTFFPAPTEPAAVAGAVLVELAVGDIHPNPRQPRQVFDEEALAELVVSLREVGMLQPIVVRRVDTGTPSGASTPYELVMGERRWRAAQQAGLERIPAIIRDTSDDAMLRDALLENLHRSQLNALEEAAAYQQLLTEFGVTHEELASRIGRSRSQVSNTIRLLGLPAAAQRRVAAGVLSAGHARALLALPTPEAIEALATRIVAEGLSVRAVEELVSMNVGTDRRRGGRPRTTPVQPPAALELASRVSDRLDTAVHVEFGRAKSRLVVEVADLDDLARVVNLIAGPPAADSDGFTA